MDKSYIIRSKEFKTSKWAGGKVTELFVCPQKSSLSKKDFDFRLSIATIDEEEAYFTPMPGVLRTLVVLEGELELSHDDNKSNTIELYDHGFFNGDSKTKSKNKAVVFNVMSLEELQHVPIALSIHEKAEFRIRNFETYEFLYVYKGGIDTDWGELNEGDLLVVNEKKLYEFKTSQNSLIVQFTVSV